MTKPEKREKITGSMTNDASRQHSHPMCKITALRRADLRRNNQTASTSLLQITITILSFSPFVKQKTEKMVDFTVKDGVHLAFLDRKSPVFPKENNRLHRKNEADGFLCAK